MPVKCLALLAVVATCGSSSETPAGPGDATPISDGPEDMAA